MSDAYIETSEQSWFSRVAGAIRGLALGPTLELSARDTLLLASDGLFDNLYVDEIVERVRRGPLEAAGRRLAEECARRMSREREGRPSKPDDVTFLVYRPCG